MKRAIVLKNINSSWAIQNRVESLQDWSLNNGICPFDIEVESNNATIVISDDARTRYQNQYQYESDISMLNVFLKDIKDPLSAGDGFEFRDIDVDKATPEEKTDFSKFAYENCGSLSCDYLNVLGLDVGTKPYIDENNIVENDSASRMELINKMLAENEKSGMESTEDDEMLGPDSPIEFYDSEKDQMVSIVNKTDDHPVDITHKVEDEVNETLDQSQNSDDVTVEEKQEAIKEVTTDTVKIKEEEHKPELVFKHGDFVKELKDACDEYNITPKGLVAVVMSLKALANNTAKAKPISEVVSTESMNIDDYKSLRLKRYPLNLIKIGVTTTKKAEELYTEIESFNPHDYIELGDKNKEFIDSINAKYIGHKFGLATFLQKNGKIGFIDNDIDSGKFDRTSTIEQDVIEESNTGVDDVSGKEGYTYTDAVPYVKSPHETESEIDTQFVNVSEESLFKIFNSKKDNKITQSMLDEIVNEMDRNIKDVIPDLQKLLKKIESNPAVMDAFKTAYTINYRVDKSPNSVRFSVIDMDKSQIYKGNIQAYLINVFSAMLTSAAGGGWATMIPMSIDITGELSMRNTYVLTKDLVEKLDTYCTEYKYGKLDSSTIGIEIRFNLVNESGLESINFFEELTSSDVYDSLTNTPTGTIFDDISNESTDLNDFAEIIESGISLESFMSKRSKRHKETNQVIEDMKKICEDVKDISAKAFKELRDRNTELFAKYGAFIKLINDIVDAVFMDKHYIKLEIARFDVQKANNEIVPDELESAIMKHFGKSILNSALGPFASLSQGDDKPGNFLLAYANRLRKEILSHAKKNISKYDKTVLTLVEDELKGSYVLTLAFAPLEISNESAEKEYASLLEKYAFESNSDDEFFQKVIADKDKFTFQEIMDCSEYNMKNFYLTGNKVKNNPVITAVRRTAYFKS